MIDKLKSLWPKSSKQNTKEPAPHQDKVTKLNPGLFLNRNLSYKPIGVKGDGELDNDKLYLAKLVQLFSNPVINLKELRDSCPDGIPSSFRARCWRLLSGYIPPNLAKSTEELAIKRKEFQRLCKQHFEDDFEKQNNKRLSEGLSVIYKDVSRTLGETKLFQSSKIRDMLSRILYVYHARNNESGYAQGMNDIVAPLIVVFTKEYVEVEDYTLKVDAHFESQLTPEITLNIEADSYWCFVRLLSSIKNNYTPGFPDVLEMIRKLGALIKKLDPELDEVMKTHNVTYYSISFQWLFSLLLRQFGPRPKSLLLDFFFTERDHINEWLVYISASFLMKFSNKVKDLNASDKILEFLTQLKTEDWGDQDVRMLLAEAHIYRNSYNYSELVTEMLDHQH